MSRDEVTRAEALPRCLSESIALRLEVLEELEDRVACKPVSVVPVASVEALEGGRSSQRPLAGKPRFYDAGGNRDWALNLVRCRAIGAAGNHIGNPIDVDSDMGKALFHA
jgi:hypothetical protein